MSKRPILYVVGKQAAERKVVPLPFARLRAIAVQARATDGAWPRETSWRSLVRRLSKNLAKT